MQLFKAARQQQYSGELLLPPRKEVEKIILTLPRYKTFNEGNNKIANSGCSFFAEADWSELKKIDLSMYNVRKVSAK